VRRRSGGDGRRTARLFRRARELSDEQRACDVAAILAADEIQVVVSDSADPGYTACLVCPPDRDACPSGILLALGQSPGRERFSLAHELGHYHIPSHRTKPPGWCGDDDMVAQEDGGRRYEWEANEFAAELLMPHHLFGHDAGHRDAAFHEIVELASPTWYDVSVTAAAIRFVDVTREACALVSAHDGAVDWVIKSEAFVYRIPWRRDPLPPGSLASAVTRGKGAPTRPEQIDPYTWLENEQYTPVELFESVHHIPTQGQVLSLVWVIAEA